MAKSVIPKSIPTELSFLGNCSGVNSTTKLTKYLSALSLIIVADDGFARNCLLQITSISPILAKYIFRFSLSWNPFSVNLADCLDLRFLNLGDLTFCPFRLP